MLTKDFYKILEINETASDSEIKSAYRRLARIHHPDIAGSAPENIKKFKDINEAYNTLIDHHKRYQYDAIKRLYSYSDSNNTDPFSTIQNAGKSSSNQSSKNTFNNLWEDFLAAQKKKERRQQTLMPENGTDITTEVVLTLNEAVNGTSKVVNILHTKPCHHCSGRKFINGGSCSFCNGSGTESIHKKLTVKIPPNVKTGCKIRIAGEGNQGSNGGRNGNLYLIIKIENNSDFKYDGIDVKKVIPITPYEAVLGANIDIPTSGGKIMMKILPNTNSGQKFRLQGQGLYKNGRQGDLIVTIEIKIPNNITEEEKELYKKLAKLSSDNIRRVI